MHIPNTTGKGSEEEKVLFRCSVLLGGHPHSSGKERYPEINYPLPAVRCAEPYHSYVYVLKSTNQNTVFTARDTKKPIRTQYSQHVTQTNQSEHSIHSRYVYRTTPSLCSEINTSTTTPMSMLSVVQFIIRLFIYEGEKKLKYSKFLEF